MTISGDALLADAARLLSDTHISLIVVCDSNSVMVGVLSKTDIVRRIGRCVGSACTTVVADVMTRDVVRCRPTDCLPDVLSMMVQRGVVHVPVVDEHSRPVGVINARDALRVLMTEEKYESSLLRDYVMGIGYR
jgi:CBS domain-containing protein